jgi:hypothetical protein
MTEATGQPTYEPVVTILESEFDNNMDPENVKNSASSATFGTLIWQNCTNVFNDTRKYPDGFIPANVDVMDATLAITYAEHMQRDLLLKRTSSSCTATLPDATGSGHKFTFIVAAVNSNGHIIKVPDSSNTFSGSVNMLDNDGTAQAAYAARAADGDDTITLNGTTTGGQIGDWVEFTDIAADKWSVRGQLVVPSGSDVADPFSATV